MTRHALIGWLVLATAGCYSTLDIGGDGASDTGGGADTGVDTTEHDTSVDTLHDTLLDTIWDPAPDTPPDTLHDTPTDTIIDPDGPSECLPPWTGPEDPYVEFWIDGEMWPGHVSLYEDCEITELDEGYEGWWWIALVCYDASGAVTRHSIEIEAMPWVYLPLWIGMEVLFEYIADPIWWVNRYFRLADPYSGTTLVGGFSGDTPNAPVYGRFFTPLWFTPTHMGCGYTPSDCYDVERMGVYIEYYDELYLVPDSNLGYAGEWGDYTLVLDRAELYHDFRCEDVPGSWYQGLFYQSMWDYDEG